MRKYQYRLILFLCLVSVRCSYSFHAFQNFAAKISSQNRRRQRPSFLSLQAKFKLDNDEDDNENEISMRSVSMTEDDYIPLQSTATTTFGAEAVPEDQRPANEYLDLISAPFFDWANRPNGSKSLLLRLAILYVSIYSAICWPISGATFTMDGYLIHKVLSSHVGAVGFILIFIFRLYSGWGYIGERLKSKRIEFEETGWYDGAIEMKTEVEIARDLLLYRQDVKPVVDRLKTILFGTGAIFLASVIGLNVLFQIKPMFNEYDPSMLERLAYDDKIADVAANQSGGVPTYCNSRYYRAVANGGQGCR